LTIGLLTLNVVNVTSRTVQLNASVTSTGNGTISERGICYGSSANPTTSGTKIIVAGGLGTFSTRITNLNPQTTYHFRSYCINETGTAYSDDVTIMTAYSSTINYNGKTLSYNGKSFKCRKYSQNKILGESPQTFRVPPVCFPLSCFYFFCIFI